MPWAAPEMPWDCPEIVSVRTSSHRGSERWSGVPRGGWRWGGERSVCSTPPSQTTDPRAAHPLLQLSLCGTKKKVGQKQSLLFHSQYNNVLSMQSPKIYRSNTFFIYLQRNIVFHVQSPTFKDQQHGFIVFCTIIFLQFKKRYRSKPIYRIVLSTTLALRS